jgi:pimeloyl-ACP methyl ester carboxylesterase
MDFAHRTPRPLRRTLGVVIGLALVGLPGCATLREHHPNLDLRPCSEEFTTTDDGWRLGIRRYRPARPDPSKLPVVLCHGLGLNGTFWTITDDHLPSQLTARGYEVFVVDMRGSGASRRAGTVGSLNSVLRHTPALEIGMREWDVDDEAFHDVPAILDHIERATGHTRVNWVGHSLGGMLVFPFLERSPHAHRMATFVAMGSPVVMVSAPETKMLNANRNLRGLLRLLSTSRSARWMAMGRPPGLDKIDRLYYSAENVDDRTIDRFYGYTLEDPGPGALRQLDHYLEFGRLVSADKTFDYAANMDKVVTPTLYVAGEGDVLAPMDSVVWTYQAAGSPDKSLARFGRRNGHLADYGHCDLVWSRHAPREIFPAVIDWLDMRQPGRASPQSPAPSPQGPAGRIAVNLQGTRDAAARRASASGAGQQHAVEADLRPGLELLPEPPDLPELEEGALGQP